MPGTELKSSNKNQPVLITAGASSSLLFKHELLGLNLSPYTCIAGAWSIEHLPGPFINIFVDLKAKSFRYYIVLQCLSSHNNEFIFTVS